MSRILSSASAVAAKAVRQAPASARKAFGSAVPSSASSKSVTGMPPKFADLSRTEGAVGFPDVNARYRPDEHDPLQSHVAALKGEELVNPPAAAEGASPRHWQDAAEWSAADLTSATEAHTMLTWGPSGPAKELPHIVGGEGVYLIDADGNRLLDWTSQAICSNFGHTVPPQIAEAVSKQMASIPYVYSGMGIVPARAKLSKLLAELMPGDITGFLFPCGGAEANEAAIRIARRYTGRHKILTQYRSYHGGTAHSLGATGDFRRWFTEMGVNGFIKIFNPQPGGFTWGTTDEEATARCLQALEEQILGEGPSGIAAVMLESVVGAGGVLVPPVGYMEGVRELCDKYGILLILDEVMAGFGRTGELWAFQHFNGIIPDIVTSAKGLTGAYLPMSMVGVREPIRQHFLKEPLGWGATYAAHPVAMACAYECVKYTVSEKLPQRAKQLQQVMMEEIQQLVQKHQTVKAGRAIGLFGCLDLQGADGRSIQKLGAPPAPHVQEFRQEMRKNGLMALFRPPLLHCCPPLVISEPELRDGFKRLSKSLETLDASVARASS